MRQEGVRLASGRRQENLASGWRQDDVKQRGARIKCDRRLAEIQSKTQYRHQYQGLEGAASTGDLSLYAA